MNEARYPGAVALPVLSFDHSPATDRQADHAGFYLQPHRDPELLLAVRRAFVGV